MAKNYYIDPVNGDNENSGTLPQEAWRTFRNVYSYRSDYRPPYAITLEPGDTIYLLDGVHSTIYQRFSFAAGENQGSLGRYYTFDEWQALTWQSTSLGYDSHSVVDNPHFISIDPNLSRYDPASNAFRPAPGSGCTAMGVYFNNLVYLPIVV